MAKAETTDFSELAAELAARTADAGFELAERLNVYPEFVHRDEFLDGRLAPRIRAMADARRLAKVI